MGKTLPLPDGFLETLTASVDQRTAKQYASYYSRLRERYPEGLPLAEIPGLAGNKWLRTVVSRLAEYLWATGAISLEDRERVKTLLRQAGRGDSRRRRRAPRVEIGSFAETLRYLEERGRSDVSAVYLAMYYSGARLEEAVHVANTEVEAVGLAGGNVRLNVHWNRGRKRCEHLWMPAGILEELRRLAAGLTARRVSDYVANQWKKRGVRLLPPVMVRKLFYQVLEDPKRFNVDTDPLPKELRDFYSNRYEDFTVGDEHYSYLLARADREYPKACRILDQALKQVLGEVA